MDQADHPLDRAARALGGRGHLATKLGVSPAAVGNWKARGVPIEHCADIERFTGGAVKRPDLRPGDWRRIWPELAREIDAATPPQTELFANGDGEGAAGHDATLTAAAPAVHHHAGAAR